ncbi:MAG TPA: Na/Pi cotransporter family protein, partial [Clostridia bacterium]|nr:Na/Pi cotransporter family protein [Clostridia bacterium]
PFVGYLTKLIVRLIPGEDQLIEQGPKYLNRSMYSSPSAALAQATKEIVRMGDIARNMLDESVQMLLDNDEKHIRIIKQGEEVIDNLQKEIINYLVGLIGMAKSSLSEEQSKKLTVLMHTVDDAERIGDLIENIMELGETKLTEKLPFSEQAISELKDIYEKVRKICSDAFEALDKDDIILAHKVIVQEDIIDNLERDLRAKHITRLNEGTCHPSSAVIFVDILSNMERIADHSTNIAHGVLGEIGDI